MFHGFLEVAVFLERFRNVDLFQQGLYHIRVRVSKGEKFAQPYDLVKTSNADSIYSLISPSYDNEEGFFSSSVFLIRYSEEEAQLREFCLFRFEDNPEEIDELALSIELNYSDFDKDFTTESLMTRLMSLKSVPFQPVCKVKIPIKNPRSAMIEPLFVEFDGLHKSILLGCLTCVFFDYRYRAPESGRGPSDLLFHHVAKLLVVDNKGEAKHLIGADETDHLYEKLIRPQALSHECLRSYLCDLINRYIPLAFKAQYSDLPPPLALPQYRRPGAAERETRFSEAVSTHDAVEVCKALMDEISFIAGQIYRLLQRFRELLASHPMHCLSPLFEKRLDRLKAWSSGSVRKQPHGVTRAPPQQEIDVEAVRRKIAKEQRQLNVLSASRFSSAIESALGDPLVGPILFEDTYFQLDAAPPPKGPEERLGRVSKKHLFVMVHGFHGKSGDLRLVKHAVASLSNHITVLCATANEANTERDLFEMGESLAQEVKQYVLEWLPGNSLGRISIIGYSLGGIIARAALPHLVEFASVMHVFITFSAPHLGHISDVSLVGAGLWVLERFRRTLLLQQLLLNDHQDVRQTALYRLSQCEGLEWFQHVCVFASYQDKYVPHDSARIEVSTALSSHLEKGHCYMDMAKNILSRMQPERFSRIDVDFCDTGVSFDSMTGRSAHLMFVTNEFFLKLLVYQYSELFT